MQSFKKTVRIGTLPRPFGAAARMSVYCKIEWDGIRLSITGVEGPKRNGDAEGSCGQIVSHLSQPEGLHGFEPAPGWTRDKVGIFLSVWDRWHLNDMRAGSAAQEEFLRNDPVTAVYPESYYDKACTALAGVGLNPDADGYMYGHAWKREEVPEDILEWLATLADTDTQPAWV